MKKLISLSLAMSMLLSATACGHGEDDRDDTNDLLDAAEDVIDRNFSGIVSSRRKYCVGEDANNYRREITDEEDLDDEWLMIVEDGDVSLFYADGFDERADCDGRMPSKYKGMTLEEIYDTYINEEQEVEPTTAETTTAPVTTAETTTTTTAATTAAPAEIPGGEDIGELNLMYGGSTPLTIISANDELEPIINNWIELAGIDPSMVDYQPLGVSGIDSSERIAQKIIAGDDIDVYFVEPDWAHYFISDYQCAAPMSDLGFTEEHFSGAYPYTIELGRSSLGEFMSPAPIASPGAFAYNAALAEEYLGVKTPEEMQSMVCDWDKFQQSAKTISDTTDGKVALADSLGGLMFAYSQGKFSPWVFDDKLNLDDFCREMADTAKNLWDTGGVSRNDQWSDEWMTGGKDTQIMGYFTANWGLGGVVTSAANSSDTYGDWAVCQGPVPYYWGGYSIAVNPATDNGDLAQSFIYYSCIDDDSMLYNAQTSGQYVNNTDVMEYAIDNGFINISADVSGNLGGQNYLAEFHRNGLSIDNRGLTTPYDAKVKDAFFNTVADVYCKGGGSYDDIIEVMNGMF